MLASWHEGFRDAAFSRLGLALWLRALFRLLA